MKTKVISIIAFMACSFALSAQTTFTNADAANSRIDNALNWSSGLPTGGTSGTIGINATIQSDTTHDDYDINMTSGNMSMGAFGRASLSNGSFVLGGSANWNTRGVNLGGTQTFTVDTTGSMTFNANNSSNWAGTSTFTLNNGTVNVSNRTLNVDGASVIINGGSWTGGNLFANTANTNSFEFTGGTTSFNQLDLNSSTTSLEFGGTTAGSVSVTTATLGGNIDFLSNSLMTFTTDIDEWAAAEWTANRLAYNGNTSSSLGSLSWADASNSGVGLGDGSYFVFDSGTETLSLVTIPEPSSFALISLGLGALFVLRCGIAK